MQLGKKSKNSELLGAMSIPDSSANASEVDLLGPEQPASNPAPVSRPPVAAAASDPLDYLPSVHQER